MTRCDPLHLEILGGVASQLEDLSSEVLQDGGAVHGGGGTNTTSGEAPALEMTMDPGKREILLDTLVNKTKYFRVSDDRVKNA